MKLIIDKRLDLANISAIAIHVERAKNLDGQSPGLPVQSTQKKVVIAKALLVAISHEKDCFALLKKVQAVLDRWKN